MIVASRTSWGGPSAPIGHPMTGAKPLWIVHHSYRPHIPANATVDQERAAIRGMHNYHKAQDWGGLSYQFVGFLSGRIYEGRGWNRTGAHTVGRNSSSYAICWVMDGSKYAPTTALIENTRALFDASVARGAVSAQYSIEPHDLYKNKVCPGDLVKSCGILLENWPTLERAAAAAAQPTLRKGKGGKDAPADIYEAVRELQRRLGMIDRHRTGYFGNVTDAAVRAFQAKNGLEPDGIVGPVTWRTLGA